MGDDDSVTAVAPDVVAHDAPDDPTRDSIRAPGAGDDPAGALILDAAVRMLADGGLSSFTVDRLSSEARVSKTSIYRRWPDKQAIFLAVMGHWGRRAEVSDLGHLGRELEAWYADRQVAYNSPTFRPVAVSLVELSVHDPELGRAMAADRRATWNTLREVLGRAIDRGDIAPDVDVDVLEQFLVGPIYYRGILEAQEITDEAVAGFLALAVRALGYEAPDGWTPRTPTP